MILVTEGDKYLFVVDTDGYAGDFHGAMAAYCTGFTMEGESPHSAVTALAVEMCVATGTQAGPDREDYSIFTGFVEKRYAPGSSPGPHPSTRYPTPRLWEGISGIKKGDRDADHPLPVYHSVAIFFSKLPNDFLLATLITRAAEYAQKPRAPRQNPSAS